MSADATFASPVLAPAPAFATYNDRRYAAGYGSRSYVTGIGENTTAARSKFVTRGKRCIMCTWWERMSQTDQKKHNDTSTPDHHYNVTPRTLPSETPTNVH